GRRHFDRRQLGRVAAAVLRVCPSASGRHAGGYRRQKQTTHAQPRQTHISSPFRSGFFGPAGSEDERYKRDDAARQSQKVPKASGKFPTGISGIFPGGFLRVMSCACNERDISVRATAVFTGHVAERSTILAGILVVDDHPVI